MAVTLIGGGARSGKSGHALVLAREQGVRLCFIATAEACDVEMQERIARHREERSACFTTVEAPYQLADALREQGPKFDAVVVDCLTLWLSNLMLAGSYDLPAEFTRLASAAQDAPTRVILVTNEVGCGIVPENALARRFRDEAGRLNQTMAAAAQEVYWMVFGCPLRVK